MARCMGHVHESPISCGTSNHTSPPFTVAGNWSQTAKKRVLPDPLNGTRFMEVPDTSIAEAAPFIASLKVGTGCLWTWEILFAVTDVTPAVHCWHDLIGRPQDWPSQSFQEPREVSSRPREFELATAQVHEWRFALLQFINAAHSSLACSPPRYVMYGDISAKVAYEMRRPEVADFFARLIQRVAPKSYAQAMGELVVTRKFYVSACLPALPEVLRWMPLYVRVLAL